VVILLSNFGGFGLMVVVKWECLSGSFGRQSKRKRLLLMYMSEFCDVDYNEELNVAFVTWKKFCRKDDYRNPLLHAIEIMQEHDGCHYVADTRNGFENESSDTRWLFDVFLPKAAATSCKMIFFIINSDNNLKEELEGQSAELQKLFDVHYCFGLDEIKAILNAKSGLSFFE
jgi:hypothetical protein